MPAPSVGTTWVASGLGGFDGARARRGGLVAVLVRDYNGAATDLSPGGTFASPFALDGQLRNDLLITTPTAVSATNQGFWLMGALDPKGVSRKPKVTSDKLEILQSTNAIRSDIQSEEKMISFTGFENAPLLDRLRMNKPLTTAGVNQVEDVGTTAYFQAKAASSPFIERQLILIRSDRAGGQEELTAEPYPRVVLTDIGEAKMDKKTADAYEMSWDVLIDPWFVDLAGVPIGIDAVWREGAGWRAGGGVPVFPGAIPVATPTTSGKATISFTNPTDTSFHDVDGPFIYSAEKSTDGGTTWLACALDPVGGTLPQAAVTVAGATTSVKVTASAGSTKFRITATLASNLAATVSSPTLAATIT